MITKHYFESHFGFPKENIDLLEGSELNPIADDGNVNDYNDNVPQQLLRQLGVLIYCNGEARPRFWTISLQI